MFGFEAAAGDGFGGGGAAVVVGKFGRDIDALDGFWFIFLKKPVPIKPALVRMEAPVNAKVALGFP